MKLFEPGKIGKLSLKNRIIMPPMATLLFEDEEGVGYGQRATDYHVARAAGGTGLIIIGAMRLNSKLEAVPGDWVISDERCIH